MVQRLTRRLPLALMLAPILAPMLALVSGLAATLLLTACGSPSPPVRDVFFRLQPAFDAAPAAGRPAVPGTLLVTNLGARGFLGGSQIVFRTAEEPLQARRYDDLLWEEIPGRALAGNLVAALRAAGVFGFVVTIDDRARADWLLGGELTRFEHLPTSAPPQVAATFTLSLVDGRNRRLKFSRTYEGEEPTGATTPDAMAAAFNRLTGRLLAAAVADLAAAAGRLGRP